MQPASAKKKGRWLETMTARLIRKKLGFFAEDVQPVGSGQSGPDIKLSYLASLDFPYSLECKNTETLNIWQALDQAEKNAGVLTPAVVFKRNRSDIYISLKFSDFLDLVTRYVRLTRKV